MDPIDVPPLPAAATRRRINRQGRWAAADLPAAHVGLEIPCCESEHGSPATTAPLHDAEEIRGRQIVLTGKRDAEVRARIAIEIAVDNGVAAGEAEDDLRSTPGEFTV